MDRLGYLIIFTGDIAGMRRFYEDRLGLVARAPSDDWVAFDTSGATLSLHAMPDPGRHGVQLRFVTDDIHARVEELADRGTSIDSPGISTFPWGSIASLRDADGHRLTLWEPSTPVESGTGPVLSAAIECRDLQAQLRFYRDTLGFPATPEPSGRVRLDAGGTGLRLQPRARTAGSRPGGPSGPAIVIGLAVSDLSAWCEDRAARGVAFVVMPADGGSAGIARAADPDGNPLTFREAHDRRTLEERLAEPFEDETAPRRTAIRRPVRKGVTAITRAATRPRRPAAGTVTKSRRAAGAGASAVPARGSGPAGARKRAKRARVKPATGRLKKAVRETVKAKKQAVAGASRRKPVKRASRAVPAKRTVARRGSGRR